MAEIKLNAGEVWRLYKEYTNCAHENSGRVSNEEQLTQYYSLINSGIQCLQLLKSRFVLDVEQDSKVTLELVKLLLDETHSCQLAEMHLSSLRERFKNHEDSDQLLRDRLVCEFLTLYTVPLRRDDRVHYDLALKNCHEYVSYLENLVEEKNTYKYKSWIPVFKYVVLVLSMKLRKYSRVHERFMELINDKNNLTHEWRSFLVLNYAAFLLKRRKVINPELIDLIKEITVDNTNAKLYAWRLATELLMEIFTDKNITSHLNAFKEFFEGHKNELHGGYEIEVTDGIKLQLQIGSIFEYRNLKNILLLFQSISYIINCYDPKANFSSKFLPKVEGTISILINESHNEMDRSLNEWDSQICWYQSILESTSFYKMWEQMLLRGPAFIGEGKSIGKEMFGMYGGLCDVMAKQINPDVDVNEVLDGYESIAVSNPSVEIKMISLINSYLILTSMVSENPSSKSEYISRSNEIWSKIETLYRESDLQNNNVWDVTLSMIWVISHTEPFTWSPLPTTDEERIHHMERLRLYYNNNKFYGSESQRDFKLKHGVLLLVMVNYLGGRLFEQDLQIMTRISEKCFKNCNKYLSVNKSVRYVMGLWALMNYTVSMKHKEVVYTRSKLNDILHE
ncbi:cohesin-loading factor complex subunit SCC4 RNJ42_03432 [Nakaseomyces bracarensis]|uniref:cohesin-loading factor complex subunit SCC4 n=1 Tax=Nakaseomyces bracarensis TaxID=273131 RepID=UPI0038718744